MSNRSNKQKKKLKENKSNWAETRKMGKTKFILVYGMLFWGLIMAVAFFFLNLSENASIPWYIHLLISLGIFAIAGYFVGLLSWNSAEKKYHNS